MRIETLLIGTASLTLIAGAAMAQSTTTTGTPPPQSPMATPNSMGATPATTDPSNYPPAPVTTDTTMTAPSTDTTTLPTRMYTTSSGVNVQVISNGPVPDTPENRAKYGQPLSHAGKKTAPAGN